MDKAKEDHLIALWSATVAQYRKTIAFLDETRTRILVNSIDITDAERAEAISRIEHIEKLISAIKVDRLRKSAAQREKQSLVSAAKTQQKNKGADFAAHPANIANHQRATRKH